MIVATRLSAVWQVAGVAAAALCCYLVSQSVASERASLDKVDSQIADTRNDIAKLHMEIGVRARMGQLESWNRDVLALQAPRPAQFVANGIQLASLYGHKGQPALQLDPAIVSQQGSPTVVAYQAARPAAPAVPAVAPPVPAAPAGVPAQPVLQAASYVRPAPDRLSGTAAVTPSGAPVVQKAAFVIADVPAPKAAKPQKAQIPARPAPAAHKESLLPDDIAQIAAREAKGIKAR